MRIREQSDGKFEVIVSESERTTMKLIDSELKQITDTEMEIVESTINAVLMAYGKEEYNSNFFRYLIDNLNLILSPDTSAFLARCIVLDPISLKKILNGARQESLISSDIENLIKDLFAKYSIQYYQKLHRSNDWLSISTDILVENKRIKLRSRLSRFDGKVLEFNIPIMDGITLAEHFIRETLDAIRYIDKERVLELDESNLKKLESELSELNQLRDQTISETISSDGEASEDIDLV